MTISPDCITLIRHYEGLARLGVDGLVYPYKDVAGYPTIGYGNRFYLDGKEVTMADKPITKNEAVFILVKTVENFAQRVSALLKVQVSQGQFDALVSFAYNLGVTALAGSTLLQKVNTGASARDVANEFMRWNKAGGMIVSGLVKRRNSEATLYQFGKLDFA